MEDEGNTSNGGVSLFEMIEICDAAISGGDFRRAIRLYSTWIDMNAADKMLFAAHFNLGVIYMNNRMYESAKICFDNSYRLNQEFISSYIFMRKCDIIMDGLHKSSGEEVQVSACSQRQLIKIIMETRRHPKNRKR